MKILFYGDSITDTLRDYNAQGISRAPESLGYGYVNVIASELITENPLKYQVINTGVSGNKVVDLYARLKGDCWNYSPDLISILIGVNDVWAEPMLNNGVDIDRFEQTYRLIIEQTKKALPNVKFILMEPYYQSGTATEEFIEEFKAVKDYALVVKKLCKEYDIPFVELQKPLDDYAKKFGKENTLIDGVHPAVAGGTIIAREWLKVFNKEFRD